MPVNTSRGTPIQRALFYFLFLLPLSFIHTTVPASSPEASTELVCHTQHALECYPAIFQPTQYFQPIHHDQLLPAGLHVRMNLATGLKEARLNVPEPPSTPHADLVVIDDPPPSKVGEVVEDSVGDSIEGFQDHSNSDRDYPYIPSHSNSEESSLFASSALTVRPLSLLSTPETFISALGALTELCHDYHWGLTLTEDAELIGHLFYIINPPTAGRSAETRSYTALLLGTAIQNNADALAALIANANGDGARQMPMQAVLATLREPVEGKGDPVLHRCTLFLLSQLAKDPSQLQSFFWGDGLNILHALFNVQSPAIPTSSNPTFVGDGHDKLRAKVANFMYDHVLPALDGALGQTLASQLVHGNDAESGEDGQKDLIKVLGPWSVAFGTALGEYAVFLFRQEEGEAPIERNAYECIWEATKSLKKVLKLP